MADITTAKKKIMDFVTKELSREVTQLKFVKISKTPDGWNGKIEITEDNVYLKKLGKPSVFDKNVYLVDVDEVGDVTNFCKEGEEY